VRNVNSKVYGLDLEAGYRLTYSLRIGANFGYSHASIKNFEISPGIYRTVRPPYSPRTQATGTLDYDVPTNILGGEVSFNGTVSYAGAIYHNIRNFNAQRFAPRTLVNLSATWKSQSSGLSVTAFGKNIFDERYGQIGFDNTTIFGGQNVSYGKPASYGVTIGYKF
jgi:outer membrane receptor protein involved in Fe transport